MTQGCDAAVKNQIESGNLSIARSYICIFISILAVNVTFPKYCQSFK